MVNLDGRNYANSVSMYSAGRPQQAINPPANYNQSNQHSHPWPYNSSQPNYNSSRSNYSNNPQSTQSNMNTVSLPSFCLCV